MSLLRSAHNRALMSGSRLRALLITVHSQASWLAATPRLWQEWTERAWFYTADCVMTACHQRFLIRNQWRFILSTILGFILANSIIVLFVLPAVFFFFSSSGACSPPVSLRILSLVWARLALTPVPYTFLYIVCRRRKKNSWICERHAAVHCNTWLVHS